MSSGGARTEWPGGSIRSSRVYMVSRGKWKIGADGDVWTFWHKIQDKVHAHMLISLIYLWLETKI